MERSCRWPEQPPAEGRGRGPTRSAGSVVVMVNGALAAYISRGARQLLAFLPEDEPARSMTGRAVAKALARIGLLVHEINGIPAADHPLAGYLVEAGSAPRRWGSKSARADLAAAHDGRRAVSETLMPEGDTIYRAAATLHKALAGHRVVRFESVFPALTRVHDDHPLTAMTIDKVESVGKHLLMHFSGALVLRTHMRMSGSWHIYRPGERWRRSSRDMRILLATADFEAVGFNIHVAEFIADKDLASSRSTVAARPRPSRQQLRSDRGHQATARTGRRPHRRRVVEAERARRSRQRLQIGGAFRLRHQPVRPGGRSQRSAARGARRSRPPPAASQRRRLRHPGSCPMAEAAARQDATARRNACGFTAARGCRAASVVRQSKYENRDSMRG